MTANAPKNRPIIFSAPMVRALLDGRKSQTRRVIKPQPAARTACVEPHPEYREEWRAFADGEPLHSFCLPYVPGDRLWVRENYQYWDWREDGTPCIRYAADLATDWAHPTTDESAERCLEIWASLSKPENYKIDGAARDRDWRPSIHQPRWASRLTLIVTDVRVQRLQDISEEDAVTEGIVRFTSGSTPMFGIPCEGGYELPGLTARETFWNLWCDINGPDSWAANPCVVAVSFRTIKANIDSAEAKAA